MTQQPVKKKKKPTGAGAGEPAEQQPDEQQQQQQQERKKKGSNPWSLSKRWKTVDINDELILGADEFGFAGLEVLEDASIIDPAILASLDAAAQQAQDEMPQTKKGKKQQQRDKKRKHTATSADAAGADDVGALKARLQQLEAENRALKKQRKPTAAATDEGGDGNTGKAAASGSEPAAAADAAKQQRKQAKKQQRQEKLRQKRDLLKQQRRQQQQEEAAQRQQQQEQVPDIDMSAWERFDLHPELVKALARQGFSAPTPIQDAVLEPAIRDRRDVIGAAQTGSGKTLAFGLPILQVLLQEREQEQLAQQLQQDSASAEGSAAAAGDSSKQQGKQGKSSGPMRALILTPTRELALQVCEHLQALGKQVGLRVIALVGGIAPVKQERMLRSCPPVVVATPGRLWDLITHGNKHLSHLDGLSFFVLDEADRMVQQGHYQELSSILELLPTAERFAAIAASAEAEAAAAAEAAETAAAVDERERRKQQPGAKRQQQQLQQQQQQQQQDADEDEDDVEGDGKESSEGVDDSQGSASQSEGADSESEDSENSEEGEQQQQQQGSKGQGRQRQRSEGVPRKGLQVQHHLLQTFVFSATLALPAQLHKRLRKGGGGSSGAASLESLMDRICFRPRPAIVDLSPSTRLAERVVEGVVTTLEDERDAVLYYLLARHPGRALVFVNAVSAVRRLAALLQLLGLPAAALHAQQQQRQRLKALDRFKASPHGVLVATDVAARGLDVPGVQMVVHYQLPASADTYIHRSGRTARTGGSDGVALALVTPSDNARWAALRKALEGQTSPPSFPVDDRVLLMAKQRVALAAKIDSIQRKDRKRHADSTWARSNAEALGITLSDDSGDEGMADLQHGAIKASAAAAAAGAAAGARRGKKRKQDALAAAAAGLDGDSRAGSAGVAGAKKLAQGMAALQRQLTGMLAVPLQPSISTKYFTGGVSRAAAVAAAASAGDGGQPGSSAAAADRADDGAAVGAGEAAAAAGELKPHTVLPAQSIAETIQLAARLKHSKSGQVAAAGGSGSSLVGVQRRGKAGMGAAAGAARDDGSKARRKAAAEAAAVARRGGVLLPPKKQKKKKGGLQQQSGGVVKPTGLARLLMSKNEVKRLKKQQGMFVVRPGAAAFGRDAQGASALDVLTTAAQRH